MAHILSLIVILIIIINYNNINYILDFTNKKFKEICFFSRYTSACLHFFLVSVFWLGIIVWLFIKKVCRNVEPCFIMIIAWISRYLSNWNLPFVFRSFILLLIHVDGSGNHGCAILYFYVCGSYLAEWLIIGKRIYITLCEQELWRIMWLPISLDINTYTLMILWILCAIKYKLLNTCARVRGRERERDLFHVYTVNIVTFCHDE